MKFEPTQNFSDLHLNDSVSFRELFEKYSKYFKWFILSVLTFLLLAFLKIRYETPQYNIVSTILIKEKDKGSSFADLSGFEDLGLFSNQDNSLENEIEILKARRLIRKVVKELNLNIRYFISNKPIDLEIYPNFPVILEIKSDTNLTNQLNSKISLLIKSKDLMEVYDYSGRSLGDKAFDEEFVINLGNDEVTNHESISIHRNENYKEDLTGKEIIIYLGSVEAVTNIYQDKLLVEPIDKRFSKVIRLSLNEPIINKGMAILNNLIEQYNADGINDKNMISAATTEFLDDRLNLISNELVAIENSAAQFKTSKGIIDAGAGANIYLQSSSLAESEIVNANTQFQLVNYMLDELGRIDTGELLPGNIGLSDPSIIEMITKYNELILQRNRISKSSSEKNPIIVSLDSQLAVYRNNLEGSLNALRSSSQIQINAINQKRGNISSKIASAPTYERDYKDIVRDQETKNALYLFLLQKREESILSNAVKYNKAKIIDHAFSNGEKVSPKKMLIYIGALFLGFLIPFMILYLKDLLDTKVHYENDLRHLGIHYLGDIPFTSSSRDLYIKEGDNTNIAEAFRYVRTNINFMLDNKIKGKTIFVTSTQSGEGKTFTAINLANSLAISGKKTLLLGMDLRAPKVNKYLQIKDIDKGITNFIKDDSLMLLDIVNTRTHLDNLDIIHSGDIPPNPVELLMSIRVDKLFEEIKKIYEFIVVDSAPVGMVTDTIQFASFANLTIYVVKANDLDKRMLHIPEKLHKEGKLINMAFLINASDHSNGTYGYGYGYNYGKNLNRKWYQKLFQKAAL